MTLAHAFEYRKPKTLAEAASILRDAGDGARVLAGGTDLIGWIRDGFAQPSLLIDLKGIEGLDRIGAFEKAGRIRIGALAAFTDLIESREVREELPLLWEAARSVASRGIRNRATPVGNICSAVPCCDMGPPLLVLEAEVVVEGPEGERAVPIGDWFVGPRRTSLRRGEIVKAIDVPLPGNPHGGCYVKLGRYDGEDLAQASVALLVLPGGETRVAFGAVAPTPVRGERIEKLLRGKEPDEALLAEAIAILPREIAPIDDVRACKEYRGRMTEVMFERGLAAARARLRGEGPPYGTRLL
ncbi:MAG: xanthine dehydrogenase family protein subunit M [Candidatus Eisenbacteria bacterium]|nr:xanthine dehydrogenase family protein subunit M [Candidatus Eisenbacteria bacterium]